MALLKYGFTAKVSTPSIEAVPHQPNSFHFPQREFGQPPHVTRCSFQSSWFAKWTWLYYNEEEDAAYCFCCIKAFQQNKLHGILNMESTYISTGHTKIGKRQLLDFLCMKAPDATKMQCLKW